jgi:hypothetical protein
MKTALLLVLLACWGSTLSAGEPLKLPSSVKLLKDLEKVKAEAKSQNKGISFMLMDPGST